MIGQQLDPGRLAAGLDRGPALDLGEERGDVGRGVRPDEVLGQLEQGDDRPVTLARRLAVRDRVAPDTQLALERGRQPRARAVRCRRLRPSAVATRTARRTSGRAKKRSPRTWNGMPAAPSASSIAGSCALVRTRMAIAPWAVPDRASARIARR